MNLRVEEKIILSFFNGEISLESFYNSIKDKNLDSIDKPVLRLLDNIFEDNKYKKLFDLKEKKLNVYFHEDNDFIEVSFIDYGIFYTFNNIYKIEKEAFKKLITDKIKDLEDKNYHALHLLNDNMKLYRLDKLFVDVRSDSKVNLLKEIFQKGICIKSRHEYTNI